jgi:hypothetical protein
MGSGKNSHPASPLGGPTGAVETGNLTRPWVSSFQFRISSFDGQGRWAEEKKFTSKPDKLLKTKERSTK